MLAKAKDLNGCSNVRRVKAYQKLRNNFINVLPKNNVQLCILTFYLFCTLRTVKLSRWLVKEEILWCWTRIRYVYKPSRGHMNFQKRTIWSQTLGQFTKRPSWENLHLYLKMLWGQQFRFRNWAKCRYNGENRAAWQQIVYSQGHMNFRVEGNSIIYIYMFI